MGFFTRIGKRAEEQRRRRAEERRARSQREADEAAAAAATAEEASRKREAEVRASPAFAALNHDPTAAGGRDRFDGAVAAQVLRECGEADVVFPFDGIGLALPLGMVCAHGASLEVMRMVHKMFPPASGIHNEATFENPLSYALEYGGGRPEIVRFLLEQEQDGWSASGFIPCAIKEEGCTPLHMAISHGVCAETIQILLDAQEEGDWGCRNSLLNFKYKKHCPLYWSFLRLDLDATKAIHGKCMSTTIADDLHTFDLSTGHSVLHKLVLEEENNLFKIMFLTKVALQLVELKDKNNHTPLDLAREKPCERILVDAWNNLEYANRLIAVDKNGNNAFHLVLMDLPDGKKLLPFDAVESAVDRLDFRIMTAILSMRNADGLTPIHVAARRNDGRSPRFLELVLAKADRSVLALADEDGNTPLHCAVQLGESANGRSERIVELLLSQEALKMPRKDGLTPLHMTIRSHRSLPYLRRIVDFADPAALEVEWPNRQNPDRELFHDTVLHVEATSARARLEVIDVLLEKNPGGMLVRPCCSFERFRQRVSNTDGMTAKLKNSICDRLGRAYSANKEEVRPWEKLYFADWQKSKDTEIAQHQQEAQARATVARSSSRAQSLGIKAVGRLVTGGPDCPEGAANNICRESMSGSHNQISERRQQIINEQEARRHGRKDVLAV